MSGSATKIATKRLGVGVIGATGYAGAEIVRLLYGHPSACLSALYSSTFAGKRMDEAVPSLQGLVCAELRPFEGKRAAGEADFFFVCSAHGQAVEVVPQLVAAGKKVVDVSADFRLRQPELYPEWYGFAHPAPELLRQAVYGLCEVYREKIRAASLVANPGCFPTGALLALYPFARRGYLEVSDIVIDAKTGISGAGRTALELGFHFPEASENVRPYKVTRHRHLPEITQCLDEVSGRVSSVTFTPHLVPASRGILTTIYAKLERRLEAEEAVDILREAYEGEPFIRVLPVGSFPETKHVLGSNFCDLSAMVDGNTKRLVLMSAIDNLVKGAAGQAVQNMNLMCGFGESEGLLQPPLYP